MSDQPTWESAGAAVVALGEEQLISGFALAGVRLCPTGSPAEVHRAWTTLQDAGLVIMTSAAAAALGEARTAPAAPLTVVLPP
jgi:vacuolar-type H+-ATPase subunit F/Vma7